MIQIHGICNCVYGHCGSKGYSIIFWERGWKLINLWYCGGHSTSFIFSTMSSFLSLPLKISEKERKSEISSLSALHRNRTHAGAPSCPNRSSNSSIIWMGAAVLNATGAENPNPDLMVILYRNCRRTTAQITTLLIYQISYCWQLQESFFQKFTFCGLSVGSSWMLWLFSWIWAESQWAKTL